MVDINTIPNISIIVAVAANNAIGKDNDLLWHISADLKRFKALTTGHAVIMGRRTWMSLPKRPLPNRRNIVLTRSAAFNDDGAEVACSIRQTFDLIRDEEESFVIGGADIYRQFLPFARNLYVTFVHSDFDGDVFFPEIDRSMFCQTSDSEVFTDEKSGLSYSFADFRRRPAPDSMLFV